jgi:uncharacterized phage-associated protein
MDSKDFAKLVLAEARNKSKKLNLTQLQKIIYICDGVLLARFDLNLIGENCQVWDYGPVYPRVYKWFSKQDADNPDLSMSQNGADTVSGNPNIKEVVDAVLDKFGSMSAKALSAWSHRAGSPWDIARNTTGMYSQISKDVMKLFFKSELK